MVLPVLLDSRSQNLLVLLLCKLVGWIRRIRGNIVSHLNFRHYLVDSALDHFCLRYQTFQNGISYKVHVKRETICTRIIDLRIVDHHAILSPNRIGDTTGKSLG
jgi:hypothetical protein